MPCGTQPYLYHPFLLFLLLSFSLSFPGKALNFGLEGGCQRLREKARGSQILSDHHEVPSPVPPAWQDSYVFHRERNREAFLGLELDPAQAKSRQWVLLALSFVMLLVVLLLAYRLYILEKKLTGPRHQCAGHQYSGHQSTGLSSHHPKPAF